MDPTQPFRLGWNRSNTASKFIILQNVNQCSRFACNWRNCRSWGEREGRKRKATWRGGDVVVVTSIAWGGWRRWWLTAWLERETTAIVVQGEEESCDKEGEVCSDCLYRQRGDGFDKLLGHHRSWRGGGYGGWGSDGEREWKDRWFLANFGTNFFPLKAWNAPLFIGGGRETLCLY